MMPDDARARAAVELKRGLRALSLGVAGRIVDDLSRIIDAVVAAAAAQAVKERDAEWHAQMERFKEQTSANLSKAMQDATAQQAEELARLRAALVTIRDETAEPESPSYLTAAEALRREEPTPGDQTA